MQPLEQSPGGDGIVPRLLQVFRHPSEVLQKLIEGIVGIARPDLLEGERWRDFPQRFRLDRALEMNVKLGFFR